MSAIAILNVASLLTPHANAGTLYWDSNGATAGAGVTPSGTWGTSSFWSTNSGGTTATANTPTTSIDTVIFSAGSDATGSPVVTVNGTQNARFLNVEEGAITFSGGTIALGQDGGITVASGAGNPVISSNLSITGAQNINVGTGRTLTLNTGTFTRAAGAAFRVQSTGTVTSTMTGLSANDATGIIGTWATYGTGTTARYATFSGNTIAAYTGVAAATAANLTDTTGQVNYDLATSSGVLPTTVSVNSIRNAGTASLGVNASSFSVNSLMHVGTDFWNIGGNPISIGANRELVINHMGGGLTQIFNVIQNNIAGTSGLTVGTGGIVLAGANTYTGPTRINPGSVLWLGLGTGGSLSPDSAIINDGSFNFFGTSTMRQGVDFANAISGSGAVSRGNNTGTTILSGINTYTGTTSLDGGVLSVSASNNLGAPSSTLSFQGGVLQITGTALTSFSGIGHPVKFNDNKLIGLDINDPSHTFVADQVMNQTTGGLTKLGAGTVALTQANTFTGPTTITAGTLAIGNGGSTGSLSPSSAITNNATLAFRRSNTAVQGTDFANAISGTGSVNQGGPGTTVLNTANTYSGGTTVSAGTLLVNNTAGSGTGTGAVTVANGGTLGGTGLLISTVTVNSGGILAPGVGIGTLSTNSVSLAPGSTFSLQINTGVPSTDLLKVTGSVNLDNAAVLTVSDVASSPAPLPVGTKLSFIEYTGSWNGGTFSNRPNGSTFTAGANDFRIDYNVPTGTGSNAITLTSVAQVPEPGSAVLLICGSFLISLRRWPKAEMHH